MIHEPSRFLRNAKVPRHLVRADTVLAISDHPNASEPFVQAEGAVFEDRSHLGRELPPRMLLFTFPHAARADKTNVRASAGRAMNAIWPTKADHHFVGHVWISKVLDRFEKSFGFAFHDTNLA